MRNRKASSALVVAGAAVAASAAAAWFGSRRLRKAGGLDATRDEDTIEFDPGNGGMLELDPSYDRLVERDSAELPIFGEAEARPKWGRDDAALDQIWNATPGFAEGEQTEGYDAVTPEDWGAVSQGSRLSSLPPDELEEELAADDEDDLDDDELELPGEHRGEPR